MIIMIRNDQSYQSQLVIFYISRRPITFLTETFFISPEWSHGLAGKTGHISLFLIMLHIITFLRHTLTGNISFTAPESEEQRHRELLHQRGHRWWRWHVNWRWWWCEFIYKDRKTCDLDPFCEKVCSRFSFTGKTHVRGLLHSCQLPCSPGVRKQLSQHLGSISSLLECSVWPNLECGLLLDRFSRDNNQFLNSLLCCSIDEDCSIGMDKRKLWIGHSELIVFFYNIAHFLFPHIRFKFFENKLITQTVRPRAGAKRRRAARRGHTEHCYCKNLMIGSVPQTHTVPYALCPPLCPRVRCASWN